MRTITTTTTRQLATGLANAEARKINQDLTFPEPDHLVVAPDELVDTVTKQLDELVKKSNNAFGNYDASALRSGQAATIQAEYLRLKDAGHYGV